MKALEGLQRYVAQDQHVRDAVLEAVMQRYGPAGAADSDRGAGPGAVRLECTAGAADGFDAGCEPVYSDCVVQCTAEFRRYSVGAGMRSALVASCESRARMRS